MSGVISSHGALRARKIIEPLNRVEIRKAGV
jgi:hypothetical protein